MNRFRTKKKVKEEPSTRSRPTEDSDGGLSFFGRRKKTQVEEEKPALDLENALPKTDDFRTSLLMTGLSARFSMLREQDDPHSKLGKASDDSVLYPTKRQSRMAAELGGFGGLRGLADIAEVESIKGSYARMNSYASASDDADSTNAGSIMNRSKPTEGNNLFGGRQKIYKIPAGAKSSGGGLSGRALYEDDVPMSSFQRWRQAERDRRGEDPLMDMDDDDRTLAEEPQRSESPLPMGYNRKRETSSTTSSAPSVQRNSTAATSVVSGPPQSAKETQNPNPAPNNGAPTLERTVTRTRRLYEQGLNQEMQDQQTSALTRIDTIRRGLGNRTPDVSANSPSPTTHAFNDRLDARRNILTKASAPNLRSFSPPASGSSISTVDTGIRPGRSPVAEARAAFGVELPLSPPVSDTGAENQSMLPIQPGDRGKATALGVFHKPSQKYDDTTYAQRQLQLQQGRDSPIDRFRTGSPTAFGTVRSRSSSSSRGDNWTEKPKPKPTLEETSEEPHTFLDDSDDSSSTSPPLAPKQITPAPPVVLERPADSEHPAFRQSAVPNPLSVGTKEEDDFSLSPSKPGLLSPQPKHESGSLVSDSPTLGPVSTTGLGGMVRSHLRSDSGASSVYGGAPSIHGAAPLTSGLETRFPADPYEGKNLENFTVDSKANPWDARDSQWGVSVYGIDGLASPVKKVDTLQTLNETKWERDESSTTIATQHSGSDVEKDMNDQNEFARELAEGARRVRERLTSYVESDSSRAASPHESPRDLMPPRPHGLGLLKPKNSRGSLVDRNRSESSNTKPIKMLGLGATTMATSPSPAKQSFDEASPMATMKEEPGKEEHSSRRGRSQGRHQGAPPPRPFSREPRLPGALPMQQEPIFAPQTAEEPKGDPEADSAQDDGSDTGKLHPGVKAFRQARREMQRLRELETQARHHAEELTEQAVLSRTPPRDGGQRERTPSRERKPPPVFYQPRPGSEESKQNVGNTSRSTSRAASERDRSGSEASTTGGRSRSRPPRLRNGSFLQEERSYGAGPNGFNGPPPLRTNMMRSPGLPGTDIRRSPHMPPQSQVAYPGQPGPTSPGYFGHPSPAHHQPQHSYPHQHQSQGHPHPHNGNLQPYGRHDSGHPSPISPMAPVGMPSSPFAGPHSGASTPTGIPQLRSRGPSAPSTPSLENAPNMNNSRLELVKKQVRKKEISDPTFVSSTSRIPTVSLPQKSRSRSRSGSRSRSSSNATQSQYAPPVPPINPRRRTDTKTRTMMGSFMGRNTGIDDGNSMSTPHLPLASASNDHMDDGDRSAFSHSEDEGDKPNRRRLRKFPSEANAMGSRSRSGTARGGSPPHPGPPPPRGVMSPPRPAPSSNGMGGMNLPGGMI
ncbi:hypothetical protein MKZ38_009743 [Zalerion maritima]|uniref:Uncharacterized protein n=1 Tax=Zalerion maritima TaxID=339359 RepID=A0AAD5WUJ2_9PEZI|nr:hypothetical protein MKZ38_009743 [Zalerion maritima]